MKKLIFVLILVLIIINIIVLIKNYHIEYYKFNFNNFNNYFNKFSNDEIEYINYCMKNSIYEFLLNIVYYILSIFNIFSKNIYSYVTFSHSVNDNKVNSSRLSIGTLYFPKSYFNIANKVIKGRNINIKSIENDKNLFFNGLGWDLMNDHFKIYYRYNDYNKLKKKFKKLYKNKNKFNYAKKGIISLTYKDNKLFETKLYLYENKNTNNETAYLFTSLRGAVIQHSNLDINTNFYDKINDTGKNIVYKYKKNNYLIDTINITNKDNFIIYYSL